MVSVTAACAADMNTLIYGMSHSYYAVEMRGGGQCPRHETSLDYWWGQGVPSPRKAATSAIADMATKSRIFIPDHPFSSYGQSGRAR